MFCETLARDACPCVLADIDQCRCCSLLMGKEFCQCDYPGVCVYEKQRWEEKQPLSAHDQVVAVFPFQTTTGAVLHWGKSALLTPGDTLVLHQTGQEPVSGVVLQTYPEQQLAYLLITGHFFALSLGAPITIKQEHNVFGNDAVYLSNTAGQSVLIFADTDLLPALTTLSDGLKKQGAHVQLLSLNENWPAEMADLLIFISQNKETLSQALKHLPLRNKSHSAFWFTK
ncbi:hypothetical protein AXX12_09115 [Anaerosporomusa subterranea]|uniref:Uncharacterized protein n=1 Tax=Anaerosporomusa subterranea TaxID=1794912 RepID=A0A154BRP6_ANASB|nr:hypothetical protein [Anaerosporomusa subterranea]KYZ76579.1 hypothetical protein AXX12_09115 [Anaerosporomusa subterranea]